MEGKRILILSEVFLIVVFSTVLILTSGYVEPLTPLKQLIKKTLPSFLITVFFLFLCFRIIEYYHSQILLQNKLLEQLNSSLLKLSSELKIEKMLQNGLEILIDFYKGDIGMIVIFDPVIKNYVSTDVITINMRELPEGGRKENYVYFSLFPNKISPNDESKIKKLIKESDLCKCSGIVILPVHNGEKLRVVGIIGVERKNEKKILKEFERTKFIVELFLTHLNLELENAMLHEEINVASITDPLTGLYNRRYFNMRLKEEFAKSKREGFPFSIMISDLDNFKFYVDKYGHPMGDLILKEVANVLKSSIRETDIICRFGGDEFAYLLPFSSSNEAKIVAERVRNNIQNFRFLKGNVDEDVHLTLSIGIASFPEHGTNENEILSRADNALFLAKNMGKNQIIIYEEKGG